MDFRGAHIISVKQFARADVDRIFQVADQASDIVLAVDDRLFARHPDQRDKLVANPDLIENGVEEILRYEAPSPIQARYVTRDVEFYGTTVPAGFDASSISNMASCRLWSNFSPMASIILIPKRSNVF